MSFEPYTDLYDDYIEEKERRRKRRKRREQKNDDWYSEETYDFGGKTSSKRRKHRGKDFDAVQYNRRRKADRKRVTVEEYDY